jgi:hypothetical protein
VAMDNGARRALVPLENKRNFLDVAGDIVERVDPVFFSDPMTAALKALGSTCPADHVIDGSVIVGGIRFPRGGCHRARLVSSHLS